MCRARGPKPKPFTTPQPSSVENAPVLTGLGHPQANGKGQRAGNGIIPIERAKPFAGWGARKQMKKRARLAKASA